MYVLLLALGAGVTWCLVNCYKWWRDIFRPMEKLPGLKWYPIFGTMYTFVGVPRTAIFNAQIALAKKFNPVWRSWNGCNAELHIMKAEHVEIILKSSTQINKGQRCEVLHPWLGQGLLTSRGSKWQSHRKLITPAFHFKILENFMTTFTDRSKILVDNLAAKIDGKFHNIYSNITNTALEIICETAMGVSAETIAASQSDYMKNVHIIGELTLWRFLRPYLKCDLVFYLTRQGKLFAKSVKALHDFASQIVADRRRQFEEKKALEQTKSKLADEDDDLGRKKRLSFLDLLLEANQDKTVITDTNLREQVDTFMFEGHDATTSSICWALFMLGNYPEAQEKAYEEIESVLQDKSIPTSLTDLTQLKYLECVIKESMRLFPSFPAITRMLTEDIEIDGYKIPAGIEVFIDIYSCHRNPEQYSDPEKFDPDRFLPENSRNRHAYSFIPFSGGPRNCIGQKFAMYEIKTVIASVMRNYRITSLEDDKNVKVFSDFILKPQNGVSLKFEKRC